MVKQSKSVYVVGSIVIGIITIIAVLAGLMLSGIIDASSKKLVFTSVSDEIIYNGETLTCDEWVLERGTLKDGHVAVMTFTGSQEEVGESENSFVVTVVDENGADVTAYYEITAHFGKLKVLPRPLSVQSGDAVEEYNGSAVKNSNAVITAGELMAGHTIEYIITGNRVDVGVTENTFVVVIRDEHGRDVTKNYNIAYTFGKLEVLPMEVAILSADRAITYDGTEHSATNDVWSYANAKKRPADGLDVEVLFSGSIIDVGTVEKKIASVVVKDGERDVSFNYKFTYAGGKITVKKCAVTISTHGAQKPYDGTPLTKDGLSVIDGNLLDGHQISDEYVITGSQTNKGYSDNTVEEDTVRIVDQNGDDVTDNYQITIKLGVLEVTDANGEQKEENPDVEKQPDDGSLTPEQLNTPVAKITTNYDGTLYLRRESFLDYTGTSDWTDASSVTYNGLLDNTYSMNYLAGVSAKNSKFSSKQAKIEVLYSNVGYILPYFQSTIQTNIYDIQTSDVLNSGNVQSAYYPNYYATDYKYLMSDKLGGYADEELAYRGFVHKKYLNLEGDAFNNCMLVAIEKGWINSDKSTIEIIDEVSDYVKTLAKYNINSNLDNQSDDIISTLLNNDGTYTALCRHYASVGVGLLRVIGIPARYTEGYMVTVKDNVETEIVVGDGHAWVEAYLNGIGWVYVECTASDSSQGDNSQQSNVIKLTPKKTVLKYQASIEPNPIDEVNISGEGLSNFKKQGYKIETDVVFEGEVNGPGNYKTQIKTVVIKDAEGNIVTEEEIGITIVKNEGVMQLYIYELTLTTGSADKIYDGKELTYNSVKQDLGYTLSQEFSSYDYQVVLTGTQTLVGESPNTANVKITDKQNGNDITSWFKIEREYGTLKVNLRPLTLRAGSLEEVYEEGKILTIESDDYKIEEGEVIEGHELFAVVSGTLNSAGYGYTRFDSVEIRDVNNGGKPVTDQYEITLIGGTLFMPFSK